MEFLSQHIESLIFISEQPISFEAIREALEGTFEMQFDDEDLEAAIEQVKHKFQQAEHAFEVVEISNGYQFLTKGAYHKTVSTFLKQTSTRRLSRAALETLSIIAYKQPVTKGEMEKIRGVSCDYSVQKLLEKELVSIEGRAEGPGRPLLYGTSEKFMDYFGLKSIADLPQLKDFKTPENAVGEPAPIEEQVGPEAEHSPQGEATKEVVLEEEVIKEVTVQETPTEDVIEARAAIEGESIENLREQEE
ncbi:MAG: SMC-Scp complex subunit ScpB [Bacteroidota bacterium]